MIEIITAEDFIKQSAIEDLLVRGLSSELNVVVNALKQYDTMRHRWDENEISSLSAIISNCNNFIRSHMQLLPTLQDIIILKENCNHRISEIRHCVEAEPANQAQHNWNRMAQLHRLDPKQFYQLGYDEVEIPGVHRIRRVGGSLHANYSGEKSSGYGRVQNNPGTTQEARRLYQKSGTTLPFNRWCRLGALYYMAKSEGVENERFKVVKQFTQEERRDYEIKVNTRIINGTQKNVLVSASGELFDTSGYSFYSGGGLAMFILSLDNIIYSMPPQISTGFHHSSFMAGSSVQAAGEWNVTNGLLRAITNKSGHYRPDHNMFLRVLFFLYNKGIDLEKVLADPVAARVRSNQYRWFYASDVLRNGGKEPNIAPTYIGRLDSLNFDEGNKNNIFSRVRSFFLR